MSTKNILGLIFSIIFIGAFAFVLSWGIINFNKVKDGMSGTGLYTKEDLNKAHEDGYDNALKDKNEYIELIAGYRDTITTLNDNISQLNSQVNNLTNNNKDYENQVSKLTEQKTSLETQVNNLTAIKTNNEETISNLNSQIASLQNQVNVLTNSGENKSEQISQLNTQIASLQNLVNQLQTTNSMNVDTITSLNIQIANLNNQISEMTLLAQNSTSQINNLNNKIAELQKSVTYYESYIAQLENGEQVVATFEYDGSVYNIQIVNKNSTLAVTTPTSTEYKIFNGWKVNGQTIDLNTYTISQNTKFVADVTYKYDVVFKVDSEVYDSQIIVKNGVITLPTNPIKDGFEFDGWSLNGVDVLNNVQTILITENTTYQAVFTKLHSVTFMFEDTTKSIQSIRNGNYATAPNIADTDYKELNGWTVNGTTVDITSYKITADTIFVASITYSYDVTFISESSEFNTIIVKENEFATLTDTPTYSQAHYTFVGWSLNGNDIVELNTYCITNNTTFYAVFEIEKMKVTINNESGFMGIALYSFYVPYGSVMGTFDFVAPAKEGFVFDYWATGSWTSSKIDPSTYVVKSNITIYPIYKQVISYVKVYDGNTLLYDEKLDKGATINLSTIKTLSRSGFRFLGWYSGNNNYSYFKGDTNAPTYWSSLPSSLTLNADSYTYYAYYEYNFMGKFVCTSDNSIILGINFDTSGGISTSSTINYSDFKYGTIDTNGNYSKESGNYKYEGSYNSASDTWTISYKTIGGKVVKTYTLTRVANSCGTARYLP